MMDLEIADYERTMEALNGKVAEKEKEVEENKAEIEKLEGRTKNLQEQIGTVHWQVFFFICELNSYLI